MNHQESLYGRCARALLALALLGAGAHAFALDPAPSGINVVIVDETKRGLDRAVLYRQKIASRASHYNKGAHAAALRAALRDDNVLVRLAIPTGCPANSTREACASVQRIADVDLPNVIERTKDSTLLIVWPEAAYFAGSPGWT